MTASASAARSRPARPLPALAQSARLRYATFMALYFAQGIPQGFLSFAVPAWLAMHGHSAARIAGYGAVALLPWSLKLVVAPLIERFAYLPMGRRRPWLLAGQAGLVLSLLGLLLLPDPQQHVALLTAAVFGVNLFVVMQDVATDSLVIDIVPAEQQGYANGLMWGAKAVGVATALAVGTALLNGPGFGAAVGVAAAVVGLISLLPLGLRERPGEKRLPWTAGTAAPESLRLHAHGWAPLLRAARRALVLRNSLLLLPATFVAQLFEEYLDNSLPLFTIQQLAWTNADYAQIYSPARLLGGVVGMLAGGWLIGWLGTVRLVQGTLLGLGALAAVLGLGRAWWPNAAFITGGIGAFCLLNTLAMVGLLALAMQCCWRRISAVQFTVYMTVFNLGAAAGTALLGLMRTHFTWETTYLLVPLGLVAATGLLGLVRLPAHVQQLAELEDHQQAQEAPALQVAI